MSELRKREHEVADVSFRPEDERARGVDRGKGRETADREEWPTGEDLNAELAAGAATGEAQQAYVAREPAPISHEAPALAPIDLRKRRRPGEMIITALLFLCTFVTLVTTVGIIVVLFEEAFNFFQEVSIGEFLTAREWTPLFLNKSFGIAPLATATILVSFIAVLVAGPLGLLAAVWLSEFAPDRARRVLKPVLEVLAGIPTVVYGYFALLFVTPLLRQIIPSLEVFNVLSAGIVMGVMILPMIASLSEDAMMAVPTSLRAGSYALGATKTETSRRVVLPAALSGIVAAFILAISRAVGETMIVTIAMGQQPKLSLNPLEAMETMTAYIVQVSLGDTPRGTIEYQTIFAVGAALFLMTLALNVASYFVLKRFREVYE